MKFFFNKLIVYLLLAAIHFYTTTLLIYAGNAETDPLKGNFFSIQFRNDTLRNVFNKISNASGYEIRYNAQLKDEKVSIHLENVDISEALKRVLKPYNHLSVWDDVNRVVTVLIFNQNSPPVSISGVNSIFELATETTASP